MVYFSACSNHENTGKGIIANRDTLPLPKITHIADLPDSSKPKQIFLNAVPQPSVIRVPVKQGTGFMEPKAKSNTAIYRSPPITHELVNDITKLPISPDAQGRGLFTSYTTDEGMSLDQIYCGYKDINGNLWFGTNGGGISKYDGKNFTNFTTANGLAYNIIWSIIEDHDGNIWVGTDGGGVSRYDGRSFTTYTTAEGLVHNVVSSLFLDKTGNLWFGTYGGGVSKYDGKVFTNYTTAQGLANNYVSDIEEDNSGNLWFSTRGGGISKFDGNGFTKYTTVNGLANNVVRSVTRDKSGNLWFGTNKGASKFDGNHFTNYSIEQGLVDTMVLTISTDKSGNLWFGTNKGISKYDGSHFINYTIEQGLANNKVTNITEDEKGNIWFGTFGGGVSKFSGNSTSNFTIAQGLANNVVYSISEDSTGTLWIGTNGGGISKYDGKSFTNYTTAQGLSNNEVYCLAKDRKGNLWFGTANGGVGKFDGKTFTNYTKEQGLANNTVFRIIEDRNGNIWFGSSGGGVSKYDGKSFTNYTTVQGLANNVVFGIIEDRDGNLWFGTLGGGVSKFDGKSFTNYTMAQGLADDVIWAITEDKSGDLWFGTQNGLSLLRLKNNILFSEKVRKNEIATGPLFESFTTKEGLPHNFITQVVEGDDHKLYIGTNMGMCELISVKAGSETENKWVVGNIYNTKTGYPVKDVNSGPGALFIDQNGIAWIGTGSDKTGLVRFDPRAAGSKNLSPPRVVLKSIKINNENICWGDLVNHFGNDQTDSLTTIQKNSEEINSFGRLLSEPEKDSMRAKFGKLSFTGIAKWYPVPEKLVLPHDLNNISFDFNAIETGKNSLVKYQYKLDGYSNKWSPPGHETSASFGNIFEGTYTFIVKAQSPEGVWSEPVTYTFTVNPPWWRTWWAYTAYALLFLWMLRTFSQFRERRLRVEKEKLEKQVKHRTVMLENTIETLKTTQSQLIQSEKMASLGELTAGIAHEIQNPLNFVNNFSEINKELLGDLHLEMEKGNMPEARDIANDILQNTEKITHHGKRADSIVKSMLQHSHSNSGQKEKVYINKLADEYLKLAYHVIQGKEKDFNAKLETHYDQTIEKIHIIPQEIGRVLLNLYNNAFYAVAEKKKMMGAGFHPAISVTTRNLGDKIELRVRDNGMGVPDKVKEKIFQPFFTTKPAGQGTGLGLSLSYDIVKTHNGTLQVNSKEVEYTELVMILPA